MIKKLVGLAALGGFLYAHKQRGGTLTLDSFKDTARGLFSDAKAKAVELKSRAEQKLDDNRVASAEDFASASVADDKTGYGTAGYSYDKDSTFRR